MNKNNMWLFFAVLLGGTGAVNSPAALDYLMFGKEVTGKQDIMIRKLVKIEDDGEVVIKLLVDGCK